jgi:hypothetical protein
MLLLLPLLLLLPPGAGVLGCCCRCRQLRTCWLLLPLLLTCWLPLPPAADVLAAAAAAADAMCWLQALPWATQWPPSPTAALQSMRWRPPSCCCGCLPRRRRQWPSWCLASRPPSVRPRPPSGARPHTTLTCSRASPLPPEAQVPPTACLGSDLAGIQRRGFTQACARVLSFTSWLVVGVHRIRAVRRLSTP